ncbi:class I SAM-dependent methyltransferase [Desulfosporosinus nitroreducens]|uniref:class I SAM-dependent methyltransferase n=1 Tax=Desulfosporosinus nitroreducens TaxID=2018668 RepID=UPI00207C9DD5|nr:class I SAM-dependent methyltransferase [Desulfosporosinus nitroreducens]MCO1603481.1 methyltransferase domain-containing protein [Desulfosporosinus nitroreducens]
MGNFEFDGEKYKAASGHQKEWGTKIVSELNLTGAESILDLGCGDGVLTKQLANLVPEGKVLGIDASMGMIKTAKELEGNNLTFSCQDINDMVFSNEFDLIFSNAALHWIKNHGSLLDSCQMALKPGGVVRFNFAGDGNCSNFYEVVRQVMDHPIYSDYFKNFEWPWYMPTLSEYDDLVIQHKYRETSVWEENADRNFNSKKDMVKWIDQPSIVPFLKFLPEGKKVGFRNEVICRMVNKTTQPDGTCFETFRRINVFARK